MISKDFNVEGTYTRLCVSNAFDVTIDDTATQITVTTGENVMPNVMVEMVDNTLKIYLKPISISGLYDLKVILPYNAALTSVDLSGASEFHSEYGLEGQKVEVELSGASNFECDIEAQHVNVALSGASDFYGDILADEIALDLSGDSDIKGAVASMDLGLELSGDSDATLIGQVTNLNMNLSGSSNLIKKVVDNRYGLSCYRCDGELSGASNAFVHCDNGIIRVNLSGASDLHYTGEANTDGCTTSVDSNIIHDVNP